MFIDSFVLGGFLVGFALWLHWNDTADLVGESIESKLDADYLIRRTKSRRRIHFLIGSCGTLIIASAFAGPRTPLWAACWLSVTVSLLVIILLALLDAWRTYRYQAAKRPEIHRKNFGE